MSDPSTFARSRPVFRVRISLPGFPPRDPQPPFFYPIGSQEILSEEANTPVYQDDIRQTQLAPNLNKLYLKAESAMEVRNWSYAISLLQAVLAKEPGFLEGRKRLRLASVKENEGKRGLKMGGETLKVMKLQTQGTN